MEAKGWCDGCVDGRIDPGLIQQPDTAPDSLTDGQPSGFFQCFFLSLAASVKIVCFFGVCVCVGGEGGC